MASLGIQKDAVTVDQSSAYPYTVHRIYLCGHPEEHIRIDRVPDRDPVLILHTIVPRPRMIEGKTVKPYKQTRQRCAVCAETHRALARHPRSLAAHQSQKQGDHADCKDGFLHVLKRERFAGRDHTCIQWPDEREDGSGCVAYSHLKKLHEKDKEDGNAYIHTAIPFRERAGRRVFQGPKRTGNGKLVYVVQTAIDSELAQGLDHQKFYADELDTMQRQTHSMRPPSVNRGVNSDTISPKPKAVQTGPVTNDKQVQCAESLLQITPQESLEVLPLRAPSQSQRRLESRGLGPVRAATLPATQFDTREAEEIARNRALTLQLLEGRTPTSTERHSDSIPLTTQHESPSMDMCTQENVPSYISHQRPFGPTRPSGGTTLSYGDQPRRYDGRPQDRSEGARVSISNIMETLFPPECPLDRQYKGGEKEEVCSQGRSSRGSYGSFRSLESQRHPGPGARGQESRGSTSSFDSQRYSGPRGRGSRGSFRRQ